MVNVEYMKRTTAAQHASALLLETAAGCPRGSSAEGARQAMIDHLRTTAPAC
jgi:hypothetical protein